MKSQPIRRNLQTHKWEKKDSQITNLISRKEMVKGG